MGGVGGVFVCVCVRGEEVKHVIHTFACMEMNQNKKVEFKGWGRGVQER